MLSQSPTAGARVRRGWQVRVTESLGGQKVNVPDMTGQTERAGAVGAQAAAAGAGDGSASSVPGTAGVVLSQSPPPNSAGLNGPRVALVVSDDESQATPAAYVMPSLVGLTYLAAQARLATVGLHVGGATERMRLLLRTRVLTRMLRPERQARMPGRLRFRWRR